MTSPKEPYSSRYIGQKIRKVRELKNFTQENLAQEMGMTLASYSRIERGEVGISLDKLDRVAQALGMDLIELLNFDETQVFNNFGQSGSQSFSLNNNHYSPELVDKLEAVYKEQIEHLKEEVRFLRALLEKQKN